MPALSQSIVTNVDAGLPSHIETYLKSKNHIRTEEDKGLEVKYWVDKLFDEQKIDTEDFEDFLFEELFWGKRKSIRIYKLDNTNKIKVPTDWLEPLLEKYQVNSLDFKNILGTIPNTDDRRKIAAITSEINYKGDLNRLRILFVCFAEAYDSGSLKQTCMYYPVEIDFVKKVMSIKAWNRQGLVDGHKAEETMEHIKTLMALSFKVSIRSFMTRHKKVLHNMSQGLIMDIYEKIPAFNQIQRLKAYVESFQQDVLKNLPLKNKKEVGSNYSISKGVLDFEDELQKALEKLCVSDFFYDIPYEMVWEMEGIDTIISKIRFNDVEHILTSLSGEASEVPIFCTKTFMALKKSMEDAETVERLWIVKNRSRGKLSLLYDATKEEFLAIRILSNIRFKQKDLLAAEEIYNQYETGANTKLTTENQRIVV